MQNIQIKYNYLYNLHLPKKKIKCHFEVQYISHFGLIQRNTEYKHLVNFPYL